MYSTLSSIAVDVVHECAIIRRGLTAMLSHLPGIALSHEVAGASEYAQLRSEERAPIAFVSPRVASDLEKGSATALSASEAGAAALIVVAPAFGDLDARVALQQGVMGLLLLTAEPGELLTAARRVFLGNRYITQSVAARVAEHVYTEALTMREYQILEFLSDGRCNKTIANELGIAVGTVKTHVKAILSKLEVSSRTQAVVVANRRGIVRQVEHLSEPVAPVNVGAVHLGAAVPRYVYQTPRLAAQFA